MTNEEQDLLIAYLVDAGEIFPDLDVDMEDQFLDWYQVRQGVVSGEAHYKAILEAARVPALSAGSQGASPRCPTARASATTALPAVATPKGTPPAWPRATPNTGTTHWKTWLGSAGSWTTSTSWRRPPTGLSCRSLDAGPRPGRSGTPAPEAWKTGFAGP